ncbi:MAG: rod-binding protein, partial [Spirochaetaceae bacterium]|nr:rod-binding protein [Spirochaetaceae bacterium]
KSALYEQCAEFESIFAKMMLKEMRNTVEKSGLVDGGWAENIFQDMLDDEYSKSMAKTANFGLADQLYRQLSGRS